MDVRIVALGLSDRAKEFALMHRRFWPLALVVVAFLGVWAFGRSKDPKIIYEVNRHGDFKEGRILGSPLSNVIDGKERLLAKHTQDLQASQARLQETVDQLTKRVGELTEKLEAPAQNANPQTSTTPPTDTNTQTNSPTPVQYSPNPSVESREMHASSEGMSSSGISRSFSRSLPVRKGPSIVTFPVKEEELEVKKPGVVLPPGSYVKGKILTGVEAPEGKTYPVLVQLDYANILPNHHRLDLAGCFMIAKATGNLSIERVEMQVTKLSCVARDGVMFERDINGFVADDKDNSFAVLGSVNSKQDRVAAMAFLASIVEGVSKAIQQAQTTQQTNALGGGQSMLTGSQMKYIGAGGASEAANTVANWYLNQAQNLLPTINVGSGRDVWVIMQESVSLPENYFKKGDNANAVYTHFTRMLN